MTVISIAAMTKKGRVIGNNNTLPWDILEELNMFRAFTRGNTVVMGRKTFDSIGFPLPKRKNIIISRSMKPLAGVEIIDNIPEAIEKAKTYGTDVYVIGGATIYEQSMQLVDKLYLSFIKEEYEGDTFFPEFNEDEWEIEKQEDHEKFEFVIYRRKN